MSMQPSILIVDDEKPIRDSLEAFLESHFKVSSVASAEEALELVKSRKFAVALVDISLESVVHTGVWLLQQLRKLSPSCQVIMITGDHSIERVIECYSQGAYGYIAKPWRNDETLWLLRRAAERFRITEKNEFLLARVKKQKVEPIIKTRGTTVQIEELMAPAAKRLSTIDKTTIKKVGEAQDALKRQVLIVAMNQAGWNQVRAANMLGIKRTTLRQSLVSLGIAAPAQHGRPKI